MTIEIEFKNDPPSYPYGLESSCGLIHIERDGSEARIERWVDIDEIEQILEKMKELQEKK